MTNFVNKFLEGHPHPGATLVGGHRDHVGVADVDSVKKTQDSAAVSVDKREIAADQWIEPAVASPVLLPAADLDHYRPGPNSEEALDILHDKFAALIAFEK